MSAINVEKIVQKVRALLDEIKRESSATETLSLARGDEDPIRLDDYIKAVIQDAITMAIGELPISVLSPTLLGVSSPTSGRWYIDKPADFLRFVSANAFGWDHSADELHEYGSLVWAEQHNPITKRGNNKPVCVMDYIRGREVIVFHPHSEADNLLYISKPTIYGNGEISPVIDECALPAISYIAASLVLQITKESDTSLAMLNTAHNLIESLSSNQSDAKQQAFDKK